MPGLAVARQLRAISPTLRITIATTQKSVERQQVEAAGFEHLPLACRPLPNGLRAAWRFLADNVSGYREARRFIQRENVSLVIGLGGHGSLPMAAAAARIRLQLVVLEQNAAAGRVNRWLAPRASLVCVAFEKSRLQLNSHGPVRVTGLPIWFGAKMAAHIAPRDSSAEQRLVVLGASGILEMNREVPKALYKLRDRLAKWQIVHQSGIHDVEATKALYGNLGLPAAVVPALKPVKRTLEQASLVISRSSGSTLAQLAAAAVPAVLLPNPQASRNHQRKNAELFAFCGAARMIDSRKCTGRLDDAVADVVGELLTDAGQRRKMALTIRSFARPDAAWHVAMMAYELAYPQPQRAAA